ncbi:hypothetical protein LA76x_3977 [Lysobacter antibioticus]|uniref:Uncharacterized protein n=1 Tax=Lysobacter antibioticus TaxID=84531 RepID=A0A0S2FEZ0_LYSAN|nr:hypothetical protein LA76x_3977 [Lysobacter antibioticus]
MAVRLRHRRCDDGGQCEGEQSGQRGKVLVHGRRSCSASPGRMRAASAQGRDGLG